ncbi:MAG: L-rhamnose/proton symporter RhaT [Terriglobia bacterium]
MHLASSSLTLGIAFAVFAGILNGTFTLPMRFLGRWSWENVWALFIVVCCVVMPAVIAWITIPKFALVLHAAPLDSVLIPIVTGFAWGFGAIMFGQGISAIGISMGNTLVLAISASLGSFIPILVLDPHRLALPQGKMIVVGTLIGIGGIISCGYAGFLKERSQKGGKEEIKAVRGEMVGKARPFRTGLLLCIGAGLLSAVFNIGYSAAQGLVQAAVGLGYSSFAGSNLVWLLMLVSGAIANLVFCGYLFRKNGTWSKYSMPGSGPLYALVIAMGLMWGGNTFLYGFAAPHMGKLGPAIGWPLLLIVGLVTANFWGFITGEWHSARARALQWMFSGLAVLLIAIIVLGWSSTLA